jgi:hypothetical protein
VIAVLAYRALQSESSTQSSSVSHMVEDTEGDAVDRWSNMEDERVKKLYALKLRSYAIYPALTRRVIGTGHRAGIKR